MVSSPAATPRGEPGVNYIQRGLCTIKTRLAASCLPQFPSLHITSLDPGTCSRKKNPPKKTGRRVKYHVVGGQSLMDAEALFSWVKREVWKCKQPPS